MGMNMGTRKAGFSSCCAPVTILHGCTTGEPSHVVPAQDLPQSKDTSPALLAHAWLPSRGAKDTTAKMVPFWWGRACSNTAWVSTVSQSLVALSHQGRKGKTGPHGDGLNVSSPQPTPNITSFFVTE